MATYAYPMCPSISYKPVVVFDGILVPQNSGPPEIPNRSAAGT
jgi:hypothetical protein